MNTFSAIVVFVWPFLLTTGVHKLLKFFRKRYSGIEESSTTISKKLRKRVKEAKKLEILLSRLLLGKQDQTTT